MLLTCPKCNRDLGALSDQTAGLKCPSCGTRVNPGGQPETITYDRPKLGRLGPFDLLERIGGGSFGRVYKAKDSRLERLVAVKVPRTEELRGAEREAFYREARTAARLRHPNIATVHEVGLVGDTIFIACELIDGVNLADLIAGHKIAPRRAAEIAAKVADALHHAHQLDVVHRDVKPKNIMIDERDEPFLIDFGLAKQSASEFTITKEGDAIGTPAYMAPEQARGDSSSIERRSDVYSLGVTLYEMLTGKQPFQGDFRAQIFQILHEDPPPPRKLAPEIPRDLETICLKAMAKQPAARYATAGEMAEDLRRYLAGEPIRARRTGAVERIARWCRRNPATCASSAVAALAIALFLCVPHSRRPEASYATAVVSPPVEEIKAVELTVLKRDGALPGSLTSVADNIEIAFWPLDETTGYPVLDAVKRFKGASPASAALRSGDYLVVVSIPGHGFHEVFRHVPGAREGLPGAYNHELSTVNPGGVTKLPNVEVPSAAVEREMVFFPAMARVPIGSDELTWASKHPRDVAPFFVDATEVTNGEFFAHWKLPAPPKEDAEPADYPVRGIPWSVAVGYSEKMGKRLLDEFEYEVAATDYGRRKFPWGDDPLPTTDAWAFGPVKSIGYDMTSISPPVFGLYSNAGEWTSSWAAPYPRERGLGMTSTSARLERVVRGAPSSVITGEGLANAEPLDPRNRSMFLIHVGRPGLGFRCGRSAQPRLEASDFGRASRTED